jgi:DNA-binding NarL/FixJ family response regulator
LSAGVRAKIRRMVEKPVRVLLLEIPQLLRGLLEHAMQAQGALDELKDAPCALEVVKEPDVSPDVVILGLTAAGDTTLLSALFGRWPHAQVMTLTPAGHDAALYELRVGRQALGAVSPAEIVQTVCEAVRRKRALPAESGAL